MQVLIVSGDAAERAACRASLDPSWSVAEAAEGAEGLRLARADHPDLVVVGEGTEPFGAFGFTRDIKLLPEPPAVIVLLRRSQDGWLAGWSGADRWLLKPLDPFAVRKAALELSAFHPSQTETVEA